MSLNNHSAEKKILISGIQPTNKLTLGNYLGAIKKIVEEQHKYETILFVADLHARTLPLTYYSYTFQELKEYSWNVIRMYVALGIDIEHTKVFLQSSVEEHLELFYFLLAHSSLGDLKRMTQYKFLLNKLKEPNQTESSLMGILVYPVLMSADILLYSSDYISVGKDQEQHLELTSAIAQRINERYKKCIFKLPVKLQNEGNLHTSKIMDLQNPDKKMSKTTDNPNGVIFLTDSIEEVKNKIMKAKTDSINKINLDQEKQPGIFNLLVIYSAVNDISLNEGFDKFKNKSYKDLKEGVSNSVSLLLSQIQKKYEEINIKELELQIQKHTESCKKIAKEKLKSIYESI